VNSDVRVVVECEIKWDWMLDMKPPVPFAVQMRQKLNAEGFKFEGDGKCSSIINENPKPLGKFIMWENYETGSTHYRQEMIS